MTKFALGDKVKNINTNEVGYVIKILPPHRGVQMYKVKYDTRENDEKSRNIILDVDLSDPFERVRQNIFGYYSEYLKGNTSFKIKSSNNSTLSSLKASRTLFKAYQFIPLLKFLKSDNKRILIADEVGLGKTIEAGHIMLELKARGEFHNALVICPMSLQAKWVTELNEKFGLDFIKIDDKDQLMQELRYHNGYVRGVVNYEKVSNRGELIKFIEERGDKFSIVVCDESHRLRNRETQLYRGVERLLMYADSVVFMSATPIMLNEDNLYNQLHLLDSNIYDNQEVFRNNLQLNAPFVRSLSVLNNGGKFSDIYKLLTDSSVVTYNTINDVEYSQEIKIDDYFKDYPIYQEIKKDLSSPYSPSLRAKIQYNLSEMSPMSNIFSRTRKKDVTKDRSQAKRNPHTLNVYMSSREKLSYDTAIEDYIIEKGGIVFYDEFDRPQSGALGLVTLKRQLASSVWATISDNKNLDLGFDEYSDFEDSKFNSLLTILDEVFKNGQKKIIIFAIFKKTIKFLNIRLKKHGYKSAVIYGDSKIDKFEVLKQFQFDDSIQVLLSSEVGSEGLDMQFCSCLVNYDLPWNPMVVEQRIGRIDRFGQKSEKVNIYNIVLNDTIVEDIYSRLLNRIGIFKESIGDLEAILDAELEQNGKKTTIKEAMKKIEKDFYSDKLTKEEVEKKTLDIENAIEKEKIDLKNIEAGLTNTLTNDTYFREEIKKIDNNNAYVTCHELQQFVFQLMKDYMTTCTIDNSEDSQVYTLHIPKSDTRILRTFLADNIPNNEDSKKLFASYLLKIQDELDVKFTFDQERSFNDKSISYINIYHPIIQAGIEMYEKKTDKNKKTFFFEIENSNMPQEIHKGNYILAIYKVTVSRVIFDKPILTESLYPILYDLDKESVITNHEIAETFMGKAQVNGRYSPLSNDKTITSDMVDKMEYDLKDVIDEYINSYRSDQQIRIENNRKMRYEQTKQYYDFRIASLKNNISHQEQLQEVALNIEDDEMYKRTEGALRLMRSNLNSLTQRMELTLERINKDVQLKVTEEVKSLNLVKIV